MEYNSFYTIFASNALMAFSIIIAFIIYLMQRRSDKQTGIESDITKLIEAIYKFRTIIEEASPLDRLPTTTEEEIKTIYKEAKTTGDYNNFLKGFNTWQFQIYENLRDNSAEYIKQSIYEDFYEWKIDLTNFEMWMAKAFPILKGADEKLKFKRSLIGIEEILKHHCKANTEKNYIENFYMSYWKGLMEIRQLAFKIDNELREYNNLWFISIFNSQPSKIWLFISLGLYLAFGIIIPIYMLQPHKIEILCCTHVFYITIIALIVSIIPITIAYIKRHKYQARADGNSRKAQEMKDDLNG
jgi:hypothetical protein